MSAMPPEIDLSTWVNLAGLPGPVAANIRQLVDSLREPRASSDVPIEKRPPLMGRFAHLMTGPGWTPEQFEDARREMSAEWQASLDAKFGDL
jgi:hypothetical protein